MTEYTVKIWFDFQDEEDAEEVRTLRGREADAVTRVAENHNDTDPEAWSEIRPFVAFVQGVNDDKIQEFVVWPEWTFSPSVEELHESGAGDEEEN